jgi:hypothetical protein
MLALVGNLVISLILAGFILGGVALFWIARQDDSRLGRMLGLLAVAFGGFAVIYFVAGHHWF